MNTNILTELYTRELNTLKEELKLYTSEEAIWKVEKDINNSAGNLTLHLIGNLKHYFGACLGNNGYVRHREDEFNLKKIPLRTLLSDIDEVIEMIQKTLNNMDDGQFHANFPGFFLNEQRSVQYVSLHLLAHFSYHLGQINYHRRLLL